MANLDSNRIVKNTIFLYLRMFVSMAVSLYTVRIVLQTLTGEDYGIYSAVGGIVSTFTVVANVLTNASQRFFSYEFGKDSKDTKGQYLFSTIFFTYLALSIIVIVVAETAGIWFLNNKMTIPEGREDAAMWVFQFALLSFVFSLLTNPFQAMIIAKEKMSIYAYISIADVVFKLLIVYCIQVIDFDQLKSYAMLVAGVHICINIIYIAFCNKISPESKLSRNIDKTTLKSVFSYSSWTLFGALAGMCNTQGLNIVLNIFWGPIANTAYAISAQVSYAVTTFAGNFALAIKPPLIKSYAAKQYDNVLKLFNFGTKTTFFLMYMLILPIFICTSEILAIWLGRVGDYMVDFVRLTLIYTLILTLSNPITNIVQAAGKVKIYHGIVDGFTLLSLPIVVVLYKAGLAINICYYVSITIFSIAHIIRIIILKKVFYLFSIRKYVKTLVFPMGLVVMLSIAVMYYLKDIFQEGFWGTISCCLISLMVVIGLSLLILFSKNEKQYIIKIINKKIIRK